MNCFFRWTEVQLPLLKQGAPTKLSVDRSLAPSSHADSKAPTLIRTFATRWELSLDSSLWRRLKGFSRLVWGFFSTAVLAGCQLAQHIPQDATVLVIEDFLRCVDAHGCVEMPFHPCRVSCLDLQRAALGKLLLQHLANSLQIKHFF